jgi:hypothetical protein
VIGDSGQVAALRALAAETEAPKRPPG